jgi:hypothetical protein
MNVCGDDESLEEALGDLDRVEGGTLSELIPTNEEIQPAPDR